jgi:hypothetical protein
MSSFTKRPIPTLAPLDETRHLYAIRKIASTKLACWGCPLRSLAGTSPCWAGDTRTCASQCPAFVAHPSNYTRRNVLPDYRG